MSFGLRWNLLQYAHMVDMTNARRRNRAARQTNSIFEMTDEQFIKIFRLTKDLVCNLVDELDPLLPKPQRRLRSDRIDSSLKVLIALSFYASGSYQTLVGKVVSVSQSTVSRAIHQVTQALNTQGILNKYISFPLTMEGREALKHEFYLECKICSVVGCIDGTHVAIIRPDENEERFFNRKGYHSLNVQIICDSDLRILNVDARYPGATHDSTIWHNHPLRYYLEEKRAAGESLFLLGDSGYSLRDTLMTPILDTVPNTPEAHYTNLHVSARNIVERCIGVLKARFRCLLAARQLHYDPITAGQIINACCVLHNIARQANIYVPPLSREEASEESRLQIRSRIGEVEVEAQSAVNYDQAILDPENRRVGRDLLRGRAVQKALVARLWQERQ